MLHTTFCLIPIINLSLTEGLTEQEENRRLQEHKRKRKFLELALPVGVLSLLCIACSLLYLVEAGQNMTIGKEVCGRLGNDSNRLANICCVSIILTTGLIII